VIFKVRTKRFPRIRTIFPASVWIFPTAEQVHRRGCIRNSRCLRGFPAIRKGRLDAIPFELVAVSYFIQGDRGGYVDYRRSLTGVITSLGFDSERWVLGLLEDTIRISETEAGSGEDRKITNNERNGVLDQRSNRNFRVCPILSDQNGMNQRHDSRDDARRKDHSQPSLQSDILQVSYKTQWRENEHQVG